MSSKRNSTIELLRIISMFLIILGHFSWHTNWGFDGKNLILQSTIDSLWIGGKLGVDLFVLISGYFIINSKFKAKSFTNVWLTSYFYSFVILIFASAFGINTFSFKNLIKTLFLSTSGYLNWFVTAYLVMYLLSPFINTLLLRLSRIQYNYLLIILILFFSVFRTIFHNPSLGTTGNDPIWLVIVYCCGAYLKLFEDEIRKEIKNRILLLIFCCSIVISTLSIFLINYVQFTFNFKKDNHHLFAWFIDGFGPLQLLSAISLFLIFINIRPFYNNFINKIASTTFAIYLIHANLLIVNWLWMDEVSAYKYADSYFSIFYGICISIIVFSVCSIIDLIRQKVLGQLHNKIVKKISSFKVWDILERMN